MKYLRTYRKNPLLAIGIFFLSVSGVWAIQPVSSAAALCGVSTGRVSSAAGAIIETNWRRYSDGAMIEARGIHVRVWDGDGRPDSDAGYGNIFKLDSGNMAIWGAGVNDGLFAQYDSGCGDGHNVVLGYDASSPRWLGGGSYDGGPWALDCDASQYGVGNERLFYATGSGVPSGARAGGSWTVLPFRPPNGFTTSFTLTYTEPAPPDISSAGVIDSATCSLVSGWTYDGDNSSVSIAVHVYIDGAYFGEFSANQPRPDVNAAFGIGGNHGYSIDISARVLNGAAHTVNVYAIGIDASGNRNSVNPLLGSRAIGPCLDYTLVPTATVAPSTIVVGQNPNFTFTVEKSGLTVSDTVAVAIKRYIILPGQTFNMVGVLDNVAANNCDTRYSPTLCATSFQLPARTFSSSPTPVDGSGSTYTSINTGNLMPGTKVCEMLAVDPASQNVAGAQVRNRWSAPACATVAKKPYVAIKNGDAWAGGSFKSATGTCPITLTSGFMGSRTTFTDGTYGSFAEYGLTSLRGVSSFGSAGKPLGTALTFANTPSSGNFSSADHCLNDALTFYGTKGVTNNITALPTLNLQNATGSPLGLYLKSSGDLTLTATSPGPMTIARNRHIVLIVDGDITINRNIEFRPGPYTALSEIPSLVVISRNGSIRVSQDVTRLDGFFQANKKFITCQEGEGLGPLGEDGTLCKKQLVVNGAVTASELILRRIYGGAMTGGVDRRNESAELFLMRPDMFLSQYGQAQSSNQLRAVDENELPPRY